MTMVALIGDHPRSGAYAATCDVDASTIREIDRVPLSARGLHVLDTGAALHVALVDDSVAIIPVDADGAFGPVARVAVAGLPCHSMQLDDRVLVSLYRMPAVAILEHGERTGTVDLPGGSDASAPAQPHQTVLDPPARHVLVCDAGTHAVLTLDATTLEVVDRYQSPTSWGPRNLAFVPGQPDRLFVTGQDDSTINEFAYDSGRLTAGPSFASSLVAGNTPAAITAGQAAVYQANREAGTIAVLSTSGAAETSELVTGAWPVDVRVGLVGGDEWLAVCNRDSGILGFHPIGAGGMPGLSSVRITAPGVSGMTWLGR